MNRNIKSIFFVLTLVTLLIAVGAVSAANDVDSTSAFDSSVSDATGSDSDTVAAESVQTASDDNNVDTKTIEKEEKNLKTATKTVEVNNYNELTTTINNAVNDADNDEYIINLNEGTYQITANVNYRTGSYTPNIIINANGQTLTASTTTRSVTYNNGCNITINDALINHRITVQVNGPVTLNNVTVNNNIIIQDGINKIGHLILNNTTITKPISNYGQLIVNDNNVFTDGFTLSQNGEIICNNSNRFYQYLSSFGGDNTLNNMTIDKNIENRGNLTLKNVTIANKLTNNGNLTLKNVTVENDIVNNGKLVISDDTTFEDNCIISGNGEFEINDTSKIASILESYNGSYTFTNTTLTVSKNNYGNLTLINSTIDAILNNCANANLTLINCSLNAPLNNEVNATINLINSTVNNNIINKGNVYIDENTIFDENGEITDMGPIYTDNIERILPNISTISGNYTISDTILNKSYKFIGNHTLNNCTIISGDNTNYGILIINNSIINTTSDIFINNYGIVQLSNNTNIINGNITGHFQVFNDTLPDDLDTVYHIITNDTISTYFDSETNTLSDIVNPGDILDFRGIISNIPELNSLIINKPVNIITSTGDGRIERFNNITYTSTASGSNVTGLYTYNTQFYVINANNILFDGISNVVNSSAIGWEVGQTAIRDNSTNIIINNSFLYTKDNGGSTSIAITYSSNCTIENTIIQAEGNVGNVLYLNTFNPTITTTEGNCYNIIRNNTLYGPTTPTGISYGIAIDGHDNLFENNKIYYTGLGITTAYSGTAHNNTFIGNEFYNGCGFNGVLNSTLINNIAYNNGLITLAANSNAYNNTAGRMTATGSNSTICGGNITSLTVSGANVNVEDMTINSISLTGTNAIINNNTIISGTVNADNTQLTHNNITALNINRAANITNNNIESITINSANTNLTYNNMTNPLNLAYSNITVQYNNITTTTDYTITGTGSNNIITDNYLKSINKYADDSVNLNKQLNTIVNNTPKYELFIDTTEFTVGETATINATIYFDNETVTDITKGKVTFKVNGKTLKDANGKVIYANIVNGTATIENYLIPDAWTKEGTTIEAIYAGSTQCPKLTSEKTNLTVTPKELSLTIGDVTATAGTTTTLTATLSDNTINNGKIIFKVNGKTVKDENGKVIYAKVVNGTVSVEYQIPDSMKAGNYNITATFIASGYDHIEASESLTVTKA